MQWQTGKKPQIPHVKQRCYRCRGSGRAQCPICNGKGRIAQGRDRLGQPQFVQCTGCFGTRHSRCGVCGGEGWR